MKKENIPKRTKILFLIFGIMVAITIAYSIWNSQFLQSQAIGNEGYFARITGRITNKSTGKPISGATIKFNCTNAKSGFSCPSPSGISDANGYYTLNVNV